MDKPDAVYFFGTCLIDLLFPPAGLSGVNFAVAQTGTLCLVENEGNGRMCTTAPDLHIAVPGIEKVVATLDP